MQALRHNMLLLCLPANDRYVETNYITKLLYETDNRTQVTGIVIAVGTEKWSAFSSADCNGIQLLERNCEATGIRAYVTKRQDTVDKLVSGKKSRPIIGKAGGGQPECCNLPVGHMSRCAEIPLVVRIASLVGSRACMARFRGPCLSPGDRPSTRSAEGST